MFEISWNEQILKGIYMLKSVYCWLILNYLQNQLYFILLHCTIIIH